MDDTSSFLRIVLQDGAEFATVAVLMGLAFSLPLALARRRPAVEAWTPWIAAATWLGFKQLRRLHAPTVGLLYPVAPGLTQDVVALALTPLWIGVYALSMASASRASALLGERYAGAALPRIGIATGVNALLGFGVDVLASVHLGLWEWVRTPDPFDGTAASLTWLLANRLVTGFAFFSAYYGIVRGSRRPWWWRGPGAALWIMAASNLWRPFGAAGLAALLALALASLVVVGPRLQPATREARD